jgi:ABC-type transport system involved in cytochrome c biogenesis permease component
MVLWHMIERELRAAARRPATHWARVVAALAPLAFLILVVGPGGNGAIQTRGQILFLCISIFALVMCLVFGALLTADCVASERREGTLDLLLLTDLRPVDILLGKLGATLIQAFYCLLAILPVLAIPFLMGGIGSGEFLRAATACVAAAFYSLCAGVYASAIGNKVRSGAMATAVLLALIPGGLCPLYWWFESGWSPVFICPLPCYVFYKSFALAYKPDAYWSALYVTALASGLYLIGANRALVKNRTPDIPEPPDPEAEKKAFMPPDEPIEREKFCGGAPALWLARRDPGAAHWMQPILVAGGVFIATTVTALSAATFFMLIALYALHFTLKLILSMDASRAVHSLKRSGEMELLSVAPIKPIEMLDGWRRALRARFKKHLIVLSIFNGIAGLALWGVTTRGVNILCAAGIWMLWVDFDTILTLGMLNGLRCKTFKKAMLRSIASMCLPPLALALAAGVACGFDLPARVGATALLLGLWCAASLWISKQQERAARAQWLARFRELASSGSGDSGKAL